MIDNETKEIKFPNGSTIIFYSPKSGINPISASMHLYDDGKFTNVFYQPVLDINEVDVRMVLINKGV